MTLIDRAKRSTELARTARTISGENIDLQVQLDLIQRALCRLDASLCLAADEIITALKTPTVTARDGEGRTPRAGRSSSTGNSFRRARTP